MASDQQKQLSVFDLILKCKEYSLADGNKIEFFEFLVDRGYYLELNEYFRSIDFSLDPYFNSHCLYYCTTMKDIKALSLCLFYIQPWNTSKESMLINKPVESSEFEPELFDDAIYALAVIKKDDNLFMGIGDNSGKFILQVNKKALEDLKIEQIAFHSKRTLGFNSIFFSDDGEYCGICGNNGKCTLLKYSRDLKNYEFFNEYTYTLMKNGKKILKWVQDGIIVGDLLFTVDSVGMLYCRSIEGINGKTVNYRKRFKGINHIWTIKNLGSNRLAVHSNKGVCAIIEYSEEDCELIGTISSTKKSDMRVIAYDQKHDTLILVYEDHLCFCYDIRSEDKEFSISKTINIDSPLRSLFFIDKELLLCCERSGLIYLLDTSAENIIDTFNVKGRIIQAKYFEEERELYFSVSRNNTHHIERIGICADSYKLVEDQMKTLVFEDNISTKNFVYETHMWAKNNKVKISLDDKIQFDYLKFLAVFLEESTDFANYEDSDVFKKLTKVADQMVNEKIIQKDETFKSEETSKKIVKMGGKTKIILFIIFIILGICFYLRIYHNKIYGVNVIY
eukprot:TRINITY_DN1608_c0_g1_i1.p1 TRINITY_DN1608_c0_g1~~TRINITY_DN1608_c0_g1_i1.p1  ORF type:complete len:563 (+),score=129.87 TRINITY_DN1608_c0_g1_i1:61-1749(+)